MLNDLHCAQDMLNVRNPLSIGWMQSKSQSKLQYILENARIISEEIQATIIILSNERQS